MMFKVGDRVVGNTNGYTHRNGKEGVVTEITANGYFVDWDGELEHLYVRNNGIDLAAPIGKTLTELDVKPGDVVRGVDCTFNKYGDFTCKEIIADNPYKGERTLKSDSYGAGIFDDSAGKWIIVSRAPQAAAEPAKPKPMHPDDAATACEQYLRDCGFTMARLDLVTALGAEYTIEPPRRF